MTTIDPAAEYRRLKEVYGRMNDEELASVADEAYELTVVAKQVLAGEIASRGLDIHLNEFPPETERRSPASGFVSEEPGFDPANLDLTVVRRMWGFQEAETAKGILTEAGIPSYFGNDNLESASDVRDFDAGVDLKVCSDDAARAMHALVNNWPGSPEIADQREAGEHTEYAIRCPRCKSIEVIFLQREGAQTENSAFNDRYQWTCDHCGHEWEDDGMVHRV
jgi:hypothetical protein